MESCSNKRVINLNTLQSDDMLQYNRRENSREYGVQEAKSSKDDVETVVLNVAKTLSVNLRPTDNQRSHRLGKKKKNAGKPRAIIVRFASNRKRMELFLQKI